jgi:cytochrome P450
VIRPRDVAQPQRLVPTEGSHAVSGPSITYDPTKPEVLRDPFPHYRQLRHEAPVHFVETLQQWAVSRYDDCVSVVRDSDVFSAEKGYGPVFDQTFKTEAVGT